MQDKTQAPRQLELGNCERSESYISNFIQACLRLRIQNNLFPKAGATRWLTPLRGRYRLDVDVSINSNLSSMGAHR